MARPALQIGYHDHCFDGVASSATFLRFYREKARPGLALEQVALRGLAHRAGQLFDEEAFAGEENAVLDFRYTKDPRLTRWFDHHQSAFESPEDEAHFRGDRSGRKFWDPTAKSCTRFLARICRERFGWDFSPLQELVDWAEVIDGAQFPDAKTAVELTEPAMQLMLLIEATKDPELCPRLIRQLSERPLSQVLREPWVVQPLAPLLSRHREVVRTVTERLRVDRGVAEYDLADLGVDNVNKFIAYAADPSAVYTVAVTRGTNRSKISLGSNPWKQDLRRHNLARIAERYAGGGESVSSKSTVSCTSSPTATPPASSARFQVRPKSLRLSLPVAVAAYRFAPCGPITGPFRPSTSRVTGLVVQCMVRSPVTLYFLSPAFSTLVDLKFISGHVCTSKKSADLRCASRFSTRVSRLAGSIWVFALRLVGSFGSWFTVPVTFPKLPCTVLTIMCLMAKPAVEWAGSTWSSTASAGAANSRTARAVFMFELLTLWIRVLR